MSATSAQEQHSGNGLRNSALAAALALALVLAGGAFYRSQAARFGRQLSSIAIQKGTLARLPMNFGEWTGREYVLDERLIRATDTDDHVCREYTSRLGLPGALMFVGYGINLRDLTPHRPEVCYVGQGWTLLTSETLTLDAPGQRALPCQILRFRQGDLSPRQRVVLHYYIADGRRGADVDWLRRSALCAADRAHYAARVQIECQVPDAPDGAARAFESVRRLALESAGPILELMPAVDPAAAPAPSAIHGDLP